jgi:hypothetical protein
MCTTARCGASWPAQKDLPADPGLRFEAVDAV